MPPATKRNATVILFDVKTDPEFAQAAKKCLLKICASKFFSDSKDLTKLILLNSQDTNNSIFSKFGKCPHVYEATDAISYNPKLFLPHIEDVKTAEADWLMGLAAALEAIKENFLDVKGIMTLQLLFISDLSTPVKRKQSRIEFTINNLNKMGVHLYILGPEVKVPHLISSVEDIQRLSKNIEFLTSEAENPNLSIAKEIVQNTKGVICGLQLGQDLFECYWEHWGLQPWKVPLTIGTSLTIPVNTTRFLRAETGPKFKAEILEGFEDLWKWHPVDDALQEVPYSNVIGGVFKHGKFVPLPEDVERDFKWMGPRGFKIIGFTDQSNIPEVHMRGDGSCFVTSEDSKVFKLLLNVLAKDNKCIIAQRIYMQNCKPKLVMLLPDPEREAFILTDLPYGNNVRMNFVKDELEEIPKLEKDDTVKAMHDYLQRLDITDINNRDVNGCARVPLTTNLMNSIQLGVITEQCSEKYLDENCNLNEISIRIPKLTEGVAYKQYLIAHPKEEAKPTVD